MHSFIDSYCFSSIMNHSQDLIFCSKQVNKAKIISFYKHLSAQLKKTYNYCTQVTTGKEERLDTKL